MKYCNIILLMILLPMYIGCSANSVFTLLDVSKNINPVILIPNEMNQTETIALQILTASFKESTGQQLSVLKESEVKNADQQQSVIYFGKTKALNALPLTVLKNDGYYLIQNENALYIASQNGQGIIYAVYDFVEHYLGGFKGDEGVIIFNKKLVIEVPIKLSIAEEPAFDFRQAYFPASNKIEYQRWYHTQHLETVWGSWGHNLAKLLKANSTQAIPENCFALHHGVRNQEQFCFSSDELFQRISSSIQAELDKGNSSINWSIAPNDNAFICECNACQAANKGTQSASTSVCNMLNKLAKKFPDLVFTTLAYATSLQAPTKLKLEPNTIVVLSTIDMPKGIALEQQKNFQSFNSILKSWNAVCNTIYVWDYPIQYTNYVDVFPILPALQKDMQYFKKAGIAGVFEQGSEYNYSIFCEWKCYAISKLLWNPSIDLKSLRTEFFNSFYGSAGKTIESFYQQCESNLATSKSTLDIYGNVQRSAKAYLNQQQLESIIAFLRKSIANESNLNPRVYYNLHKLTTCLEIVQLQLQLSKGIGEGGYAIARDATSWTMQTGLMERISKLKKACKDDELEVINENGNLVQDYLVHSEIFLATMETKNLIWNKAITFNTQFDDSFPANGKATLSDGMHGTSDYSFNWLLFNNTAMDVSIVEAAIPSAKKVTVTFLHDPAHYIFNPTTIKLFAGKSQQDAHVIGTISPKEMQLTKATSSTYSFDLNIPDEQKNYFRIVAETYTSLPSWKQHPSKKPTLACDEINIQ